MAPHVPMLAERASTMAAPGAVYTKGDLLGPGLTVNILSTIAVACRIYVRCIRKRTGGLDDICIVVALGLAFVDTACGVKFMGYGIGKHIWELQPPQIVNAMKWLIISTITSYIELFFIRLSIGIFILRMLTRVQFKLRVALVTAMVLNFLITLMICLVVSLWCRPMEGIWNKFIPAKCLSGETLNRTNRAFAGTSAAIDILYACLPVIIFWQLHMDFTTKRNLTIVALFTLVICVCAIGKTVQTDESGADLTYENMPPVFWAVFEGNLGIIVASLPALRQFCMVTRDDITTLRTKSDKTSDSRGIDAATKLHGSSEALRPSHSANSHREWYSLHDDETDNIDLTRHAVLPKQI